ncbi:MAG TPA: NUDIX hydrolase [Syntrophorhabdaceae bacterium]|nr:NUDIX hydrolase [Syntrophorhabdaceae bacterium]
MVKKWRLIDEKVDRDYRVFKVNTLKALSPRTNAISEFYTIETKDWVNVIPVTEKREVVMIKQYRHGSKEITLEIPGGLVDNEHHKEAALRELLEETGYTGEKIVYLGAVNPNPAIFNNLCHTYLVEDAKKIGEKNLDPDEDIEVVLIPISEIHSLIHSGKINHALVVVAFYLYFAKTEVP